MGKKKDDSENANGKVPPVVIKQPFVDRKKVPLAASEEQVAGSVGAIVDRKRNPKVTGTEQENLINSEKPGIAAAALALADAEQNPRLMDSLIAGEQPGVDLKDVGIGESIGGVAPVIDPKPTPKLTAETVSVTILSRKKSKYV